MRPQIEYQGEPVEPLAWRGLQPVRPRVLADAGQDTLRKLSLLLHAMAEGWTCLPLDPRLPSSHRERLLRTAAAGSLLLEDGTRPVSASLVSSVAGFRLLIATSGTRGEPRLVELDRPRLEAAAEASNHLLGLQPGDAWLLCLPLHHVAAVAVVVRCGLAGARVVVQACFAPSVLLARLARGDITHLSLVPTQLYRLLREDPAFVPPPALRVVLLGGAPAEASLVHEALARGWPVCPSYGLTEAASQVATCHPPPAEWSPGLAGQPLSHVQVAIAEDGRIRLRGPSIAQRVIAAEGVRQLLDDEGWYTTGDLGRIDPAGRLWVLGRADEVIISGGEKVHPATVERVLQSCPGVDEVAVVGVPDSEWGERLVACYRGEIPPAVLMDWAREHLAGVHRPSACLAIERLPRNALGKLLRHCLREDVQLLSQ